MMSNQKWISHDCRIMRNVGVFARRYAEVLESLAIRVGATKESASQYRLLEVGDNGLDKDVLHLGKAVARIRVKCDGAAMQIYGEIAI